MSIVVDMNQELRESTDFELLTVALRALIGHRCLQARMGYGDELKLHFGAPQVSADASLSPRGDWVLCVRASIWRAHLRQVGLGLYTGTPSISSSAVAKPATPKEMVKYANLLAGSSVVETTLTQWFPGKNLAPGLLISFNDGSFFELAPPPAENSEDGDEDPIADWELFTPYNTYIRVGPGQKWSMLRSDVPLAAAGS